MQAFVLDRAGHYEFLCKLIPGARHLTIGASTDEHAVNPWDVEDPANPPIEKIAYLVALHALLVGDHRAGEDAYGLDALERNLLEVAIRAVYARAAREQLVPRERLLCEELRRRAEQESAASNPRYGWCCRQPRLAEFQPAAGPAHRAIAPTISAVVTVMVAFIANLRSG